VTCLHPDAKGTGGYQRGCRCPRCCRALSDYQRLQRRRASAHQCPDCHGVGGVYAGNRCDGCYQRHRQGLPPVEPVERECANCLRAMPSGKPLRNSRCEACARYLSRNGRERPLHVSPARLDVAPLVEFVAHRGGIRAVMQAAGLDLMSRSGRNVYRTWHRWLADGTVTATAADLFCVETLGVHPCQVYGDEFHQGAA
jgi:hypothetical protein